MFMNLTHECMARQYALNVDCPITLLNAGFNLHEINWSFTFVLNLCWSLVIASGPAGGFFRETNRLQYIMYPIKNRDFQRLRVHLDFKMLLHNYSWSWKTGFNVLVAIRLYPSNTAITPALRSCFDYPDNRGYIVNITWTSSGKANHTSFKTCVFTSWLCGKIHRGRKGGLT